MNKLKLVKPLNESIFANLDIRTISNNHMIKNEYLDICKKHNSTNGWIMMINPEEHTLEELALLNAIDTTRVLKVNARNRDVKMNSIERTLLKGNCSALILCNPKLKRAEVRQLTQIASKASTQCIILNHENALH